MPVERRLLLPRFASLLLAFAAAAALLWMAFGGWSDVQWLAAREVSHAPFFIATRWGATLLVAAALALFGVRLARDRAGFPAEAHSWLPLRLLVYLLLAGVLATSWARAAGFFEEYGVLLHFFASSSLMASLSVWLILLLAPRPRVGDRARRILRAADLAGANLAAVLVLSECVLSLWAGYSASPLFWDANSVRSTLIKFRFPPHAPYFDTQMNSGGYHDEEFVAAEKDDFVVALLADSFGTSAVPYAYNFATVAENILRASLGERKGRVAIHNFGIACTGVPEYLHILQTEALALRPSLVVVCVFVGNDIEEIRRSNSSWRLSFQDWWLWILTERILAIQSEEKQIGRGIAFTPTGCPDYVHDTSLEPPSFTPETYVGIEAKRFDICNPALDSTRRSYDAFFKGLDLLHHLAGDRLLILAIPDEFQVNDELYRSILESKPDTGAWDREYPQRRIQAFCDERGIALLDPLEDLRQAQKRDRVYHLRNSHWNANGNRVAGEALARKILEAFAPGRVEKTE